MHLVHDWRRVIRRAYSFHFAWLAGLFGIIGQVSDIWSYFDGILPLSPQAFNMLGIAFAILSAAGRLIKQPKISGEDP